ncbi:hypothetical protein NDU88_000269 [Pleurodeles waltl]|uniref:Transmembrane protein n=1 Tax=Pleurodeles waltl TaxID=8319 RepID=A0AAV7VVM1_PLEWA|nr:hypothetical protein NDU88_000269 [Pleurodeles waltl]
MHSSTSLAAWRLSLLCCSTRLQFERVPLSALERFASSAFVVCAARGYFVCSNTARPRPAGCIIVLLAGYTAAPALSKVCAQALAVFRSCCLLVSIALKCTNNSESLTIGLGDTQILIFLLYNSNRTDQISCLAIISTLLQPLISILHRAFSPFNRRLLKQPGCYTGPTIRGWPINKCPRGTSANHPRLLECASPEVDGYVETPEGREKARGRTERVHATSGNEEDARPETEEANYRRTEETSVESAVTEMTRESEFSAEADSRQEDANSTRHVRGGRWLLQVRAYLPNLYSYVTGMKAGKREDA